MENVMVENLNQRLNISSIQTEVMESTESATKLGNSMVALKMALNIWKQLQFGRQIQIMRSKKDYM